jgi:hypothetical protein
MQCPENARQTWFTTNGETGRSNKPIDPGSSFHHSVQAPLRPLCPYCDYDGNMLSTGKDFSYVFSHMWCLRLAGIAPQTGLASLRQRSAGRKNAVHPPD